MGIYSLQLACKELKHLVLVASFKHSRPNRVLEPVLVVLCSGRRGAAGRAALLGTTRLVV